jgi:hypothetical protein
LSLSGLFSCCRKESPDVSEGAGDSTIHPTKVLAKFLSSLHVRSQPLLLDLGPVIGTNVTFFGEQLGCKIRVENVFEDLERHVSGGALGEFAAFLETRFTQEDDSIDGILCWDVLDYMDRPAGVALARHLSRILRPEGALLAQFGAAEPRGPVDPTYTKYVVVDRETLQYRPYAAARGKQHPLLNRDIQRIFEPLRVSEQFLLKNNLREVLFRKPPASPAHP